MNESSSDLSCDRAGGALFDFCWFRVGPRKLEGMISPVQENVPTLWLLRYISSMLQVCCKSGDCKLPLILVFRNLPLRNEPTGLWAAVFYTQD